MLMFLATFLCLWKAYREKVRGEMEHLPQIPLRSHHGMHSLAHPPTSSSSHFLYAGRGRKEGGERETAERKEQEGRGKKGLKEKEEEQGEKGARKEQKERGKVGRNRAGGMKGRKKRREGRNGRRKKGGRKGREGRKEDSNIPTLVKELSLK